MKLTASLVSRLRNGFPVGSAIPSLLRLARGLSQGHLRGPTTWREIEASLHNGKYVALSMDCFGTLINRLSPDWEQRAIASMTGCLAGLTHTESIRALRSAHAAAARGRPGDPEPDAVSIWTHFCNLCDLPQMLVEHFCAVESELLAATSAVCVEALATLKTAQHAKIPFVITSDTRLTATALQTLLREKGIELSLDALVCSCDSRRSKFRGGLYSIAMQRLSEKAGQALAAHKILHIGDNRISDGYSAASSGIASAILAPGALTGETLTSAAALRAGFESLGPAFSIFCHKLHGALAQHRLADAIFVARDGYFLRICAQAWWDTRGEKYEVPRYARISRVSARLASLHAREDIRREAASITAVRAGIIASHELCTFLGLSDHHDEFFGETAVPVNQAIQILSGEKSDIVLDYSTKARKSLANYLRDIGSGVFVDVGWKGTTASLLDKAFPKEPPRKWLLLARWSETGVSTLHGGDLGLVIDQSKDGGFVAKSAKDLYALVEAICSENAPPTIAYSPTGIPCPSNWERTPSSSDLTAITALRKGIFEAVPLCARVTSNMTNKLPYSFVNLSRQRLFRFAHFPDDLTLQWAQKIIVTETHSKSWSTPLCGNETINPMTHPLNWLAGFACPWKAAWAYRTGGRFGSVFWLICNFILHTGENRLEQSIKRWLAK